MQVEAVPEAEGGLLTLSGKAAQAEVEAPIPSAFLMLLTWGLQKQ